MKRLIILLTAITTFALGAEGELKWRYEMGGSVWSSPAIGPDGTIYIGAIVSGAGDYIYAINPDGSLKWRSDNEIRVGSALAVGSDGSIYACVYMGFLCALKPDGTENWRFERYDMEYASPAIASDGSIICWLTDDVCSVSPEGELNWTSYANPGLTGVYSSPVIEKDGTIYVGVTGNDWYGVWMYAIGPDSTKKWEKIIQGEGFLEVTESSAIDSDGTVYFGTPPFLYAVNPDGSIKWKSDTIYASRSSPAIAPDGTIYLGSEFNALYAINPDGTTKWCYEFGDTLFAPVTSSPAIAADGTVYVGARNKYIYAINPDSTLRWRFKTGGAVESSPAVGSDGTVYVGSHDGYLYAIEGSAPLANSPWPKFRHDNQNTGRVGGVSVEDKPKTDPEIEVNAATIDKALHVTYVLPEEQNGVLQVYDALGRRVEQMKVRSSGEAKFTAPLSSGVYWIRLESKAGQASSKVVLLP